MTDHPSSASDARRAAVALLDKVLGEGLLLSECQTQILERLEPADRARAQRLALEVLRALERADRVLAKHLRKPPALHVR
ncbi:16S rRNA methyltransferase, partial [Rhodobacteraceae bacterium R_SAG7]|nr:16S rRNA methyltransferase [Rhodobacteraceae bacterium R_SAG7]